MPKALANSNHSARRSMLGPAPVLKGEDSALYDDLLAQVSAHVKPANIIEEFWVDDIVDLTGNIYRYRRYRMGLIEAAIPKALEEMLTPFSNDASKFGAAFRCSQDGYREPTPAMELVNKWVRREPRALKKVDTILAAAQLTMEDVRARAFAVEIDKIRQIEILIANAEARRNAVLREISYHRATFADALRDATQNITEGEYELVAQRRPHKKRTKAISQVTNH